MDASTRRIDIKDLSEASRLLTHEVLELAEEDGTEEVAAILPFPTIPGTESLPNWNNWDQADREAWKRLMVIRDPISRKWTSPLSASEVLEEQRAGRQKALESPHEA